MEVYIHHDRSGAIHGLYVVSLPAGHTLTLMPEPGLFVSETDNDALGLPLEIEHLDPESIREAARSLRVDPPIPRCTLISNYGSGEYIA